VSAGADAIVVLRASDMSMTVEQWAAVGAGVGSILRIREGYYDRFDGAKGWCGDPVDHLVEVRSVRKAGAFAVAFDLQERGSYALAPGDRPLKVSWRYIAVMGVYHGRLPGDAIELAERKAAYQRELDLAELADQERRRADWEQLYASGEVERPGGEQWAAYVRDLAEQERAAESDVGSKLERPEPSR
jgi:hypothetical protein